MDLLFFLILGHLFGDYALQSDYVAEKKKSSPLILLYHVILYALCIWMFFIFYSLLYFDGLFYETSTLLFLGFLFIEHWLQDYIKGRSDKCSKQMYFLDQAFHLTVLYLYRIFIFSGR